MKHSSVHIFKILLTDFTFILFAVVFGIGCARFGTLRAPYTYYRLSQVFFHTISNMFDFVDNPNTYINSQISFVIIGLSKMMYTVFYWKQPIKFTIQLVQGISAITLATIHSGISVDVHEISSGILAFTALLMYGVRLRDKKLTGTKLSIYLHIVIDLMVCCFTIAFCFGSHWAGAFEVEKCGFDYQECKITGFNVGYAEWPILLTFFALDWFSCSELLDTFAWKIQVGTNNVCMTKYENIEHQ